MTNLRDEIANVCMDYGADRNASADVADDILAAIKASVPELVWERNESTGVRNVHNAVYGRYRYVAWPDGGWRISGSIVGGTAEPRTLEDAKAAANAHHVAQLTDWMGQ